MTQISDVPSRYRGKYPPACLYVRGNYQPEIPAVAIVGTRACSDYGREVASWFASFLVENGIAIISGLARGIDSVAHLSALESGGITYAVLGCGVDSPYPVTNEWLADRIVASNGAILSEYEPGTPPSPKGLALRNRIIAGLSDALIVVEAPQRSGALIAADFAKKAGVPVGAVPGKITSQTSAGTYLLISEGARMITHPGDILHML
ncbi:MAG: DNA-processing protein DprA [Candidatus Caldarchaeum sp.]